ncbi:hypothetical protein CC85DRAFT_287938 [Cutaneotrichosporon oleaginosum]|uniref:Fibronectin type-III domain-containing protein n=1 Tax=Cutaneotrichosporon oleaginosum TaxID=879819 RepID=A0A0J0XG51_9TREE|nr:uncharacterized protein CC85DRAFT_287938 [Cutaneotrichosporon oleaginosum]KLT40053.1 hypothetical protein CC85DRAFT_287938 [Cutaneotrichosporon oleaginosum]
MRLGVLYLLAQAMGAVLITPAPSALAWRALEARQASNITRPQGELTIHDVFTECASMRVSWTWPGSTPPYRIYVLEWREGSLTYERTNLTDSAFVIPALPAPAGYQAEIGVTDRTGQSLVSPKTTVRPCADGGLCGCTPPVSTTRTGTPSYRSPAGTTRNSTSSRSSAPSSYFAALSESSEWSPPSELPSLQPSGEVSQASVLATAAPPSRPGAEHAPAPTSERANNLAPVIGGVVGGTVAIIAFLAVLCLTRRRRVSSHTHAPSRRLSIDEDLDQPAPAPFFSDEVQRECLEVYHAHYLRPAMANANSLSDSRSNSPATLFHPSRATSPSSTSGQSGLAGIGRRDLVARPFSEPRGATTDFLPTAAALVGLPPRPECRPTVARLQPERVESQQRSHSRQEAPRLTGSSHPPTHTLQSARATKAQEARRATHAEDAGFVEDGILPPLYRQEWEADRLRRINVEQ